MKRNILIFGGLGFIGSNLIRKIIDSTEDNVIVVDNFRNNQVTFNQNRITVINSDLVNQQTIYNIIKIYMPQIIINLVGSNWQKNIKSNLYQNILGTFNLFQQLKKVIVETEQYKLKLKVVQYGTLDVYNLQEKQDRITQHTRYNPTTLFGAIKLGSQVIFRQYAKQLGITGILVHTGNVIANSKKSYVDKIIKKLLSNQIIYLDDQDYNINDWVTIQQVVDGILYLIQNQNNSQLYNIGKLYWKSKRDIIYIICQIMQQLLGKEYKNLIIQKQLQNGQLQRKIYNIRLKNQKIRKLKFKVQNSLIDTDFKNIINEIINKYLKR